MTHFLLQLSAAFLVASPEEGGCLWLDKQHLARFGRDAEVMLQQMSQLYFAIVYCYLAL